MRTTCSLCGNRRDGAHKSYCKACMAKRARLFRASDPERAKDYARTWAAGNLDKRRVYKWRSRLINEYGFTRAEAEVFMASADHCCAICKIDVVRGEKGINGLAVDHDHETGEYRGVLCQPCNMALGLLKDDPDIILSAAEYVESSKSTRLYPVEEHG